MAFWILLIFAGVQCTWWFYYFLRVSYYDHSQRSLHNNTPAVSIVICFKELPKNFEENLEAVQNQEYPDFELILVNDFSSDKAVISLKSWINTESKGAAKMIHASQDLPGKKLAQHEGVLAAKNDLILFTDIDCKPAGLRWIHHMIGQMQKDDADVVLGYGPLYNKSGFVAWFAGFETVVTALQYFGFHFAGETYMSVGRNWMVSKKVYLDFVDKAKGKNLASGDDDLLLQAMDENIKIGACLNPESFMYSDPKTTFSSFFRQKIRHISTSYHYPLNISVKLFLFAFSITGYYVLLTFLGCLGYLGFKILVQITLIKWMVQTLCHSTSFKSLKGYKYVLFYPFAEITLAAYYPAVTVMSLFFKRRLW